MARLFEEVLREAMEKNIIPSKTVDARNWFRDTAESVSPRDVKPDELIKEEKASLKRSISIGKMFLFNYQPKTVSTLPYYDKFPLIFPFDKDDTGFYGLNMHYLPLPYRAVLMDGLYSLTSSNIKENSSLKLSYDILSGASKLKYFRPCVKHYLNNQLRSRFLQIPATQWDIALFLPLERFVKANKAKVHKDSVNIIRGNNGRIY